MTTTEIETPAQININVVWHPAAETKLTRTIAYYEAILVDHDGHSVVSPDWWILLKEVRKVASGYRTDVTSCTRIVQLNRSNFPPEMEQQYRKDAMRSLANQKNACLRSLQRDRVLVLCKQRLGDLDGWQLARLSNDDLVVEVDGIREWNSTWHKMESVYSTKRFPMKKDGTFNWKKIQEEIECRKAYKARTKQAEEMARTKQTTVEAYMKSLREAFAMNTNGPLRSSDGQLGISVTVTVEQATRLLIVMDEMGMLDTARK